VSGTEILCVHVKQAILLRNSVPQQSGFGQTSEKKKTKQKPRKKAALEDSLSDGIVSHLRDIYGFEWWFAHTIMPGQLHFY